MSAPYHENPEHTALALQKGLARIAEIRKNLRAVAYDMAEAIEKIATDLRIKCPSAADIMIQFDQTVSDEIEPVEGLMEEAMNEAWAKVERVS